MTMDISSFRGERLSIPTGLRSATAVLAAGLLAGLSAFSPGALAVDTSWDAATGDWFDGANWDTGNVPTNADNVFIDGAGTAQVQDPGAQAAVFTVGVAAAGTLTIEDGGTVSVLQGRIGQAGTSTGAVTVTGTGSTWTDSSGLFVGHVGTGTLAISDGGAANSVGGTLGNAAGGTGEVTVTGAGSAWTNSSDLFVGGLGVGTLTIEAGGAVNNTTGAIGDIAGGMGEVTVSGAGSAWTNSSDLFVGGSGTGTLAVEDGGTVNNHAGYIGASAGGTGEVTVTGAGSVWTNSFNLGVGNLGTGTLAIEAGGAVSNIVGAIGAIAGSTGEVTVTGVGSTWTNSSTLSIGLSGAGTLTVADGATVTAASTTTVGSGSGSTGTLNLNGTAGSRGVLVAPQVARGSGSGTVDFDGGVLQLSGNRADLFIGFAAGDVTLNAGGAFIDTQGFTVGTAAVLDGAGGLTKQGSGTLTLIGASTYTGGTTVSFGTLDVDGGSITHAAAPMSVGNLAGDEGTLLIQNGGDVNSTGALIGVDAGSVGAATVTGTGSTWTNIALTVGESGDGTLAIEAGGTVSNTNGRIGFDAGSTGEVTVTGTGSAWTNSSILTVGQEGDGALVIENGGEVSNTAGTLALNVGSTGEVTVTGAGSTWTNSANLTVGNAGTGTLAIEDGGAVSNTGSAIGANAGSTGEVTVTGAGSTWTNSASLFVGFSGAGTLAIEAGGAVSNTSGSIGTFAGSTSEVTVTGVGSTWTNSANLTVGTAGTGTLAIEASGAVSNTGGSIGAIAGSTGEVTVTGVGSTWTNSANLTVGTAGTGTLAIEAGGVVSNTGGSIGANAGSTGAVTVTGAGSTWTNSSGLFVGNSGTGTLTIEDGATVTAAATTTVGVNGGSNGALNLDGTAGSRGMLVAPQLERGAGAGTVDFDGGVLRLTGTQANLLSGFAAGDVTLNAGGAFIDTQGFTVGTAAVLDGAGGLTKQGSGTLNLTGSSTYSGGTLVDEGALGITNGDELGSGAVTLDGATLSLNGAGVALGNAIQVNAAGGTLVDAGFGNHVVTGDVALNGDLLLDGANVIQVAGDITGSGALNIDITSTVVLTGDATHTGGTLISTGALHVGANGTTGSISGDIVNNSELDFRRSDSFSVTADISGTGTLSKFGAGTLTLGGDHTYSGDTFVVAGSLEFTGDTSGLGGDVTNDTALIFNQATDSAFSGVISSAGTVTKSGAGTLILTGANTYSGGTTVNAGTLSVNGSIASTVTVNAGGTLGGTGSVGNVALNGGTFAPGNSMGTMTVNGDVDFSGGGIYEMEVDAPGQSDRIDATGTATLTGGSVEVIVENGDYEPVTEYLILTADGGIDGEFDEVGSNLTFLAPELSYDANNVFLALLRSDVTFASVAETPNQMQVAGELDAIGIAPGGDFEAVMNALLLLTPEEARSAFEQLSGVQHTHGLYVARQALRGLTRLSFGRLGGGGRNPGLSGLTLAFSDEPWAQQLENHWVAMLDGAGEQIQNRGLWVRGYGVWGDIESDGNAAGADYDTAGLALGLDAEFGEDLVAGVSGGYAGTDTDSLDGELDGDTFQLAGYAGFNRERWYAHGLIGYAWHEIDSTRPVTFAGFASTSEADYDMTTFSAALEVGYDFAVGPDLSGQSGTTLTPFAAFDYARSHRESYTESGPAGLAVGGETAYSLRPTFGVRLAHTLTMDTGAKLEPVLYAAYAHEVLDSVSRVQGTFAAAPADGFLIDGPETDRGRFLAGAAINTALTRRALLTLAWDAELADSDTAHALSVTFRYRW